MYAKKPRGRFAKNVARVDFVSIRRELLEPTECTHGGLRVERGVTFEAHKSRDAFNFRSPPYQHGRIARGKSLQAAGRSFGDSNGTIAEASQNLTDFPGALRGGL